MGKIKNYKEKLLENNKKVKKLFDKNKDCKLIFSAVVGSVSYGLDVENSDVDQKGIYIQNLNYLLKETKIGNSKSTEYKPQLGGNSRDFKDLTFYELGRYLDLLSTNNPNILELLNTPKDCIIYKDPIWDEIVKSLNIKEILSKKCYYTFYNYAEQQIKKATGLNKKINNPVPKEKKNPLNFCFVINSEKTEPLSKFLKNKNINQKFCGVKKLKNAKDVYCLYYDNLAFKLFSNKKENIIKERKEKNLTLGYGFKGIIKESDDNKLISNEIRLSSIPKNIKNSNDIEYICIFSYNKDGYTKYCKQYKEYWDWVKNRNEERWKDNISNGRNYDGKNLSHCLRLLYMAKEIAEEKKVKVRRPEHQRKELLDIKKGKIKYENIIKKVEITTKDLKDKYNNSDLLNMPNLEHIKEVLLKIRKKWYNI